MKNKEAYVYALIDNRYFSKNYNKPFYIGLSGHLYDNHNTKKYARAYDHFLNLKKKHNQDTAKIINDILNLNLTPCIKILHENLTIQEAIKLEKYYIKLYGRLNNNTGILTNHSDGGEYCPINSFKNKNKYKLLRYYRLLNKRKEEREKKFENEIYMFLNSKFGSFCILYTIKTLIKLYKEKPVQIQPKNSNIGWAKYNRSEKHKQRTAYLNSIKPKVSSVESRLKLSNSQKRTWQNKSSIEKKIANDNKILGKAFNVIKRINGYYINQKIYDSNRTLGMAGRAEPRWKSLIKRFDSIENFLNIIAHKFNRILVYEN